MSTDRVTRADIHNKLAEIQGDATDTVEGAKSQIVAVAAVVGLVFVAAVFLLGKRAGAKKSTIIELRRN
jgi:hypothetical protein